MADPAFTETQNLLPPPAPPLPPSRLGQLQRIIAPWGRHIGSKFHGGPSQGDRDYALRQITSIHTYSSLASPTATHRTGIPIAALDINQAGTHAILAGKDILKTVRVHDGKVTEDLNLRAAVSSYASTHTSPQLDDVGKRREYLPARDVRWSTGNWDHIIATAATNGRIALYDLKASGLKTELAWLHEHTGQINKLDFDPSAGYLLLSASQDKSVRLWDLRIKPDKAFRKFDVRSAVRDVRWSPSALEPLDFAICADGGLIQKWDARSPSRPILSISGHEKACYSLDWHPDGRHVISGGFDKYIRVWDFQSDNRRQKPVLQLKAPHAVRNIRWRPPSRASQTSESGYWQSTQVAVSYYHDDPRIHIWDLRRPLLPFRELDKYNTPPNDMLWANQDMLWTVGDEGIFTQWDLKHTTPFYNQISPCVSEFTPDGQFYMFSEDREIRHAFSRDDPAAGFLTVPPDKLSSGDDGGVSRSFTDDEGSLDTSTGASSRRQGRAIASTRSNKSQASSPPSLDDRSPVLPLDKAVLDRDELFNNAQVGVAGCIPGVAAEPEVVEFLATHYAIPASEDERRHSPNIILQRLEVAFNENAAACDAVSMHRMAQSWRILGAVIVPELKDWADANRAKRRADAARRRETLESFRLGAHRSAVSPLAGLPHRGFNPKNEGRSQKLMNSLLKDMVDAERGYRGSELDSTSNMNTPLAKPVPNSSPQDRKRWSGPSSEEAIESIAPLPPSLLTSHSTAVAAARALIDSPERRTTSNASSPEILRPVRSNASQSTVNREAVGKSPTQVASPPGPDIPTVKREPQNQEDRRAALRDYRAQARPIFTLDEAPHKPESDDRNDSADSFLMFSASTDSSHKARSLARSFESPGTDRRTPHGRGEIYPESEEDAELGDSSSDEYSHSRPKSEQRSDNLAEAQPGGSSVNTPLDMSLGHGEQNQGIGRVPVQEEKTTWNAENVYGSVTKSHFETGVSSSPDIFHFEEGTSLPKPRIHTSNPIRTEKDTLTDGKDSRRLDEPSTTMSMEELDKETYLFQDFRPIDLSRYEPKLPFAWSSLPLVCQSIAFDVDNGIGHGQFASHLLLHVQPYFFHPRFRTLKGSDTRGDSLADRLMIPHLGHRVIESILENHLLFLKQLGCFESAALLRKMCVELEYPRLYTPSDSNRQNSSSLSTGDSMSLLAACANCQRLMMPGMNVCDTCRRLRSVCPICESIRTDSGCASDLQAWGKNGSMWMYCQACGHSGHVSCLMEWFAESSSEGACPAQGCGCDCGPGLTRVHRIQEQMKREEEARLIRGGNAGNGSTKRDPLRATPSPAVDKARVALRKSVGAERATQSGDERSIPAERGSNRSRPTQQTGFSSSRKSVRLVTPREEDAQSQT
ncbi:hypothetical protein A1O3_04088 [Capronia epimyces CBS 606.96]|uniref:Restriction of telomere capping protein 1 n=1 Tax=Capronia epimyces CBS 606.96 TaxID=1182542 RepID=W9YBT5_9EURO|nr:uncharacterized protein A1O3_04088 [Capronia epimyces CBS 606.96]EXJ87130.1 hypothetical protein A1O3_04088 [Capronia epimyces CBS 606.96]